jgi:hypothetical protein
MYTFARLPPFLVLKVLPSLPPSPPSSASLASSSCLFHLSLSGQGRAAASARGIAGSRREDTGRKGCKYLAVSPSTPPSLPHSLPLPRPRVQAQAAAVAAAAAAAAAAAETEHRRRLQEVEEETKKELAEWQRCGEVGPEGGREGGED